MRFLADVGISRSTLAMLRELGHEVVHLTSEGLEKLQDAEILAKARSEERILLAFDLDFGDLSGGRPLGPPQRHPFPLGRSVSFFDQPAIGPNVERAGFSASRGSGGDC